MKVPVIRTKTGGYQDMKEYCIGLENDSANTVSEHIRVIINKTEIDKNCINRAERFVQKKCTLTAMTNKTIVYIKWY